MDLAFSIFTPTYNRRDTLQRVYESLKLQTFSLFEWIIIDDGSSDGTAEIVNEWINEGSIPILYFYQNNAGKHVAQNRALDMASAELFLPLDSDDTVVPNCLEILWNSWISIPDEHRYEFSGVGCCCMDKNGNLIGDAWPENGWISNDLEAAFIYKITGEKWGPVRTDIMKMFKNKEVKGHFLPENTVWFRIAKRYKKVYINDCLRIYGIREDSVQKRKYFTDEANAEAKMTAALIFINEFWDWYVKYNKFAGYKQCLIAVKSAVECNRTIGWLFKQINYMMPRIIILLASPYKILYRCMRKVK